MPIEFAPPVEQTVQPFTVPAPQTPDPLQTLAQMSQLKTQALQQQGMGMQVQQQQMDMQSQQGMLRAYKDANGDIDQMLKIAPSYGVLPKDIFSAQQMALKAAQDRATLDKTKMESHDMWRDQVHAILQPMFDETNDPVKQATLAATLRQKLVDQGLITPDSTAFQYTDPESAVLMESGLNTDKWKSIKAAQMNAQTAAKRLALEQPGLEAKAEDDARSSAASQLANTTNPADYEAIRDKYIIAGGKENKDSRTAAFPASGQAFDQNGQWIPGTQALVSRTGVPIEKRPEYDIKAAQRDAMMRAQSAIQNGTHPIDAILPASTDQAANASYRSAYDAAMTNGGPEAANHVVEAAAAHAAQIAMAGNPQIRAGEVAKKVAETQATAPLEVAKAISVEKAKAALSPDVFNQIVDPGARMHAMNDTLKYTKDYTDKQNDAQRLLDTIGSAQKGNQAASGLIPLEEVRAIVNRVNRQELEAVGGNQGSLLRRVDNWLSTATTGKASADQLNDLRALANLSKTAARRGYDGARRGTQAIYGITPPDVDAIPAAGGAPAAAPGPARGGNQPAQYRKQAVGPNGHTIGLGADNKWHDVQTGAVIQ